LEIRERVNKSKNVGKRKQQQQEDTVKKVWLVAALVGLSAMASSVFADVQNIRLSGDVRVRGYYLKNANSDVGTSRDVNKRDTTFITQRTRITCEADLEDHVLVVVTLKAENQWGRPGTATALGGENTSAVGVSEAYVQLSEMFFTPATLKLGRQYLNYGHGLILSSVDQVYNYDAGRLVLDFYPFTVDVVGAKLFDGSDYQANPGHFGRNLLFINGRYEMKDAVIKDVEAYFGWIANGSANQPSGLPAGAPQASPWILGVRGDLTPVKNLSVWFEAAYEGGSAGGTPKATGGNGGISAWLANIGAKYSLGKDVKMQPTINASYTFASGGGTLNQNGADQRQFRPFAGVVEGYNGYLFAPALANIHIFNLGASVKPAQNVTLSLQGYYYAKASGTGYAGTDEKLDFGGMKGLCAYQTAKKELGYELDAIATYDYSKDVRFQLIYAVFMPGQAFTDSTGGVNSALPVNNAVNRCAHELRAEVNVKF
jgi:hypothetical protein